MGDKHKGRGQTLWWFYKTTHLSVCHVHITGSRSNLRSHLMGIHISPHQWGTTGSPKWWQKGIRKRDFMLLPPECHSTCNFSCASCHHRPSGLYKCHFLVCVQGVKGTVVFTQPWGGVQWGPVAMRECRLGYRAPEDMVVGSWVPLEPFPSCLLDLKIHSSKAVSPSLGSLSGLPSSNRMPHLCAGHHCCLYDTEH